MNVQTFTAASMPAALAKVKETMGGGAVILHTRRFKRGGLFGIGARVVVEVSAADGREVAAERRKHRERAERDAQAKRRQKLRGQLHDKLQEKLQVAAPGQVAASPVSPRDRHDGPLAGDLIRQTYAAAKAELVSAGASTASQPAASSGASIGQLSSQVMPQPATSALAMPRPVVVDVATVPDAHAATDEPFAPTHAMTPVAIPDEQLTREVEVVKRMVAQMLRQQREQAAQHGVEGTAEGEASAGNASKARSNGRRRGVQLDMPEPLFEQYLGLLKQEVAEDLAEEIVGKVRRKLGHRQMENAQKLRDTLLEVMVEFFPDADTPDAADAPVAATADSRQARRPRVVALIGPTGVGKTTTIAKLAANFKLRQKRKVGLITLDTYRIAAVEQLRTYANIIGLSLKVVREIAEMGDAIRDCSDCDVVFIDTAGRSPRDDPKLEQLSQLLSAAKPDEVHLVLSATCTQSALIDAAEKFSKIPIDRVIFSKLDEAVTYGVLLNVSRKIQGKLKAKLSYVTTGQEVPHDIEPGRPQRLAELVLGGDD